MDGTLNGIPLNGIAWVATEHHSCGFVRHTFHVSEKCHAAVSQSLVLGGRALLNLSSQEIEGRVIYYGANTDGYNITIETPRSPKEF